MGKSSANQFSRIANVKVRPLLWAYRQPNFLQRHDRQLSTLNAKPTYRRDIDGLRAIAVLAVIGFHAFPAAVPGGFVGVDVFFVISGFLISTIVFGSLERGGFSYVDFYDRRIRRIFPALIIVLVATWIAGWRLLYPLEYANLGKHIASGAGFVSNFMLWRDSGYFDTGAEQKPLLHLWSLAIEEQFYLVWPLGLVLTWRFVKLRFALIGVVALSSFGICVWLTGRDPVVAYYFPVTRFWELLMGAMLAYSGIVASRRQRVHLGYCKFASLCSRCVDFETRKRSSA